MNSYKNDTSAFCFIPAKMSSTRLRKKNILKIKGKELLYYAINSAKESGIFGENIIVSTESSEIREIAEKYGATVPYIREEKLTHDPYQIIHVMLDFFEKNKEFLSFKTVCIILPTCPLLLGSDIKQAYEIYLNGEYNYLMSVTETDHNSLRSVYVKEELIEPLFPDKIEKRSQELAPTYRINGAIVIIDVEDFLIKKKYYNYPLGAYVMPRERSIDIDTEYDFMLARFLMENQ